MFIIQIKLRERNILIPTWEATVLERQGAKVIAQLDFPVSGSDRLPVRSGDSILLDSYASSGGLQAITCFMSRFTY